MTDAVRGVGLPDSCRDGDRRCQRMARVLRAAQLEAQAIGTRPCHGGVIWRHCGQFEKN